MKNNRTLLWTNTVYLMVIWVFGAFIAGTADAASPKTITKKIVIAMINEPDTLDLTALAGDPRGRSASGPWQLAERPEGNCLVGCHFK